MCSIAHASVSVLHLASAGTHQECLYKLMALGLPYFSLPVTNNSELTVEDHARLIEEEKEIVKYREAHREVGVKRMQEEKERLPPEQYDYSQLEGNNVMNQGTLSGLLSQTAGHYSRNRGPLLVG